MATYPSDGQAPWSAALKTYIDTSLSDGLGGKADVVSGKIPLSEVTAGTVIAVHYTGSAWPARPTTRTDITVHYYALTSSDPAPTDFVTDVDYLFQPTV